MAASCERCRHRPAPSIAYRPHVPTWTAPLRRGYQTAGSPALRGSVAAASEPSGARRAAVDQLDGVLVAEAAVERAPSAPGRGRAPRAPRRCPGAWRGSRRTSVGGSKWSRRLDVPARRRHRGRDVDAAIDDGRHELGVDLRLGVAAHRAGDDPRARPGRRGTASRGAACGASACRGSRTFGWSGVQAEVGAPVLVVDAGLRIDHARAEAEVVRLDEADRVALPRRRRRGRSCRRRAGWSRPAARPPACGSIRAASSAA